MDVPSYQRPWADNPDTTNTKELAPQLDDVDSLNFAYRGGEQHGVPSKHGVDPLPEAYEPGRVVEYEDLEPEPVPVPVRIVNMSSRQERLVRTGQVSLLSGVARQVVSQHLARETVKLVNVNADTVFIGSDPGVDSNSGFPLRTGDSIQVTAQAALYAIYTNVATASLTVAFIEEYTVNA